jgi:ribosomal-protein-alanine N-acetyltransferase
MSKDNIEYDQIKLIPATIEDYPIIQNMGRFYVYDMSEYMANQAGWEIPKDGLYECKDFKKYWQAESTFPFLIRYKAELAGFVIIDTKGSDEQIDFNMAQFFILRKFKNKGLGQFIACHCFDKFKGTWEVMVMPGNHGAYQFWKSVITKYTHVNFIEYTLNIKHFNDSRKNIFRFNSQ